MTEVWVLWWKYSDGSGAGVSRAYADKARANQDLELLTEGSDPKQYYLEHVAVYCSPQPTT